MIVYGICYVASYLAARIEHYYVSGFFLMAAALWLYWAEYQRSRNLIHLRGLFSLFWVGGQGLACLKLSSLSSDWMTETWICFAGALLGFWLVFEGLEQSAKISGRDVSKKEKWPGFKQEPWNAMALFQLIFGVTLLSLAAFTFEAVRLHYIPLLVRGVPHAYSEFHISGVHYFTVSCVLVPSLFVLYLHTSQGAKDRMHLAAAAMLTAISIAIPILCVSRFQFIFAVMLAAMTFIALHKSVHPLWIAAVVIGMIPVYLLLTVARSHDVAYLNSIFEMKYEKMPIFITQPYMYIANNYDNFNCLVEVLPEHSYGMKGLFPLWALTGLKFVCPSLVDYPIYVDKAELTTVTLFYDAYYDFGLVGVLFMSCVLGGISWLLVRKMKRCNNPIAYLFYAQIAGYMMLSFFTTWFSNPATWFYLILTGCMYIWYQICRKNSCKMDEKISSGTNCKISEGHCIQDEDSYR